MVKNSQTKIKKLLHCSVIITTLIFPLSPTALSAALEARTTDCLNFYKSTIEGKLVLPLLDQVKYFSFPTPHGTQFLIVDLAQISSISQIGLLVKSYFEHVQTVYKERLKKFSDDNIEEAAQRFELDQQLAQRSILVLDTPTGSPAGPVDFIGGIRVTYARTPEEKLPLQYDFPDYQRYDSSGTSVEIGRLTAQSEVSPRIAIGLVNMALRVALQQRNVRDFYVYTSKAHSRLYKLMGFNPSQVDAKDDLNYILRFTLKDATDWLEKN